MNYLKTQGANNTSDSNGTSLPRPVTSSLTSGSIWKQLLPWLRRTFTSSQSNIITADSKPDKNGPTPKESYVHWCVDSTRYETALNHIPVISKETKDKKLIEELRKKYRKTRGLRYWFSLTTCCKIKLIEVRISHSNFFGYSAKML